MPELFATKPEGVDVEYTWDFFEQKARYKGVDPATFGERLSRREPQYARRWQGELSEHLADVPHFEQTMRELRRAIRPHA